MLLDDVALHGILLNDALDLEAAEAIAWARELDRVDPEAWTRSTMSDFSTQPLTSIPRSLAKASSSLIVHCLKSSSTGVVAVVSEGWRSNRDDGRREGTDGAGDADAWDAIFEHPFGRGPAASISSLKSRDCSDIPSDCSDISCDGDARGLSGTRSAEMPDAMLASRPSMLDLRSEAGPPAFRSKEMGGPRFRLHSEFGRFSASDGPCLDAFEDSTVQEATHADCKSKARLSSQLVVGATRV